MKVKTGEIRDAEPDDVTGFEIYLRTSGLNPKLEVSGSFKH